jgi:hypothetical protein
LKRSPADGEEGSMLPRLLLSLLLMNESGEENGLADTKILKKRRDYGFGKIKVV